MEEGAWLVARSECERGFGTMTYNDEQLNGTRDAGAGEASVNMNGAGGDSAPHNECGELLGAGGECALDQFHEQALKQAGCGIYQLRIIIACALAVGGSALELASVPFILPSAEMELCIRPQEKSWLVLISLVGCALGAACGGVLGARVGRRRALVSALAVNGLFAAVGAFMPTYPTFMMARFCSALGSGGIVPITFAYVGELVDRGALRSALGGLTAGAACGSLASAALAGAILPPTGELTLKEDREHFSAWHRYLLLCTLPIIASLVLLIWAPESPRYLLHRGREVDAMTAYQNIYSGNQILVCRRIWGAGAGAGAAAGAGGGAGAGAAPPYRLRELALPGKRPHSRRDLFWVQILQLFSITYRRTTLCLGGILLCTITIQMYLSSFVPETVARAESQLFRANRQTVQNTSLYRMYLSSFVPETVARAESQLFRANRQTVQNTSLYNNHLNNTIENVNYFNVSFSNCTFRDMLISHVLFRNCSFYDVSFSNIKTSYTMFEGCQLINSTFIDTDIELGREMDEWCVLNGTVIRGMQAGCARRADLASRLQPPVTEQTFLSYAMMVACGLTLVPEKYVSLTLLCCVCVLLAPGVWAGAGAGEGALYAVEAAYRGVLTLVWCGVGGAVQQLYPHAHRSTAHGLMTAVSYIGGAVGRGAGAAAAGGAGGAAVCAGLAIVAAALAGAHRT